MFKLKKYKIARRLGPIFEKTQTQKFALSEARHAKGKKRGKSGGRRSLSTFGSQLIEKQKIRYTYGLYEKQFVNYVKEAQDTHTTTPTEKLYELLERRLDTVASLLGLAGSRRHARQLVSHGHLIVNGKKVTTPSFRVSEGDSIAIREGSRTRTVFAELEKKMKTHAVPHWIRIENPGISFSAKIVGIPTLDARTGLDWSSVLEYYSR